MHWFLILEKSTFVPTNGSAQTWPPAISQTNDAIMYGISALFPYPWRSFIIIHIKWCNMTHRILDTPPPYCVAVYQNCGGSCHTIDIENESVHFIINPNTHTLQYNMATIYTAIQYGHHIHYNTIWPPYTMQYNMATIYTAIQARPVTATSIPTSSRIPTSCRDWDIFLHNSDLISAQMIRNYVRFY